MSSYPPTGILMAGLPHTGKTSYLALLYLAIAGGHCEQVQLGTFTDDREYLNEIGKRLLQCQLPIHTEVSQERELALSLRIGTAQSATFLRIPDLSGETWETALVDRHWRPKVEERAREAAGVLLFVHVGEFDGGATIAEADAAEAALSPESAVGEHEAGPEQPHGRAATQVEVVDLLQLLCEERAPRPARVSIVLSAYDLAGADIPPAEWLTSNCPLVAQYLEVNRSWLHSAVFGVSAQGGRFDEPEERESLQARDFLARSAITTGGGLPATVEAPLLWVLGTDGG